jgi:hypothetical protein
VTTSIQAHANAVLNLLRADALLTVYDSQVPSGAPDHYALVYTYRQLAGGLIAPDKTSLVGDSSTVDMRFYIHCVGADAVAARAVQGRVENALSDVTPSVAGRACFPIRWVEGTQADRDEETLAAVFDNVDVYSLVTVPG